MPGYKDFLAGFGLMKNLQIGNWIVTHILIEHQQIIRYEKYQYPIELTFQPLNQNADLNQLYQDLMNYTKDSRVIYSKYGNPYNCTLTNWQIQKINDHEVLAHTVGEGVKIH